VNIKQNILLGGFLIFSSFSFASSSFEIGDEYVSILNKIKQNPRCENISDLNQTQEKLRLICKNKSSIGFSEKLILSFEKGQLKSVETQSNGLNLGPIKLKPKEIVAWFKKYFSKIVLI
jgi:hypothetical protein